MVVENIDNQLKEYAAETFENIASYFMYMHGILQNEELRITESFREMCLIPHNTLRRTLSRLNDFQNILNEMRELLNQYKINIPSNISLQDLAKLYSRLEKIPTEVHVTKINSNPFFFKSNEELLQQQLHNLHQYKFIDPNLIVEYFYSNSSNQNISTIKATCLEEPMDFSLNISRTLTKKVTNNQIKFENENIFKDIDNKGNVYGKYLTNLLKTDKSFSGISNSVNENQLGIQLFSTTMDVLKAGNTRIKNLDNMITDSRNYSWLKVNCTVQITCVESPESFYIQNIDLKNRLRELSNAYIAELADVPKSFVFGKIYMTYHTADKQWYRAVIEHIVKPGIFKVFLVDIGLRINVATHSLHEPQDKHAAIPHAAVHCSIYDIVPRNCEWTPEANNLLLEITQNRPIIVSFAEEVSMDFYKVDLLVSHLNMRISIREVFLYTGLAHERIGNVLLKWETKRAPKKTFAPLELTIPEQSILQGKSFNVVVLNVISPDEFFVIKREQIMERDQMLNDLNSEIVSVDTRLHPIYLAMPKLACITNVNGQWQRASVDEIIGQGEIRVILVDIGETMIVCWRDIYALPAKFFQNQYALKCSLADVQPVQINNSTWTPTAVADFRQLSSNPNLKMDVLSKKRNVNSVVLHIRKQNKSDINVATMLVKHKHAISTGRHSQITEQINETRFESRNDVFFDSLSSELNLNEKEMTNFSSEPNTYAKTSIARTAIKVIRIINLSKFYVTLTAVRLGVKTFHEKIQDFANSLMASNQYKKKPAESKEWRPGDHCLVKTKIQQSNKLKWFRGIITDISSAADSCAANTCKVFLRDEAISIVGVPINEVFFIDKTLDRASSVAICCHLVGLKTVDSSDQWSEAAVNAFKSELSKYRMIFATQHTRIENSIGIILWGLLEKFSDPMSPATKEYVNINEVISKLGFATWTPPVVVDINDERDNQFIDSLESIDNWLKNIDKIKVNPVDDIIKSTHHEEVNYFSFFDNLNDLKSAKQKKLPQAWQMSRPLKNTVFTAKPQYVDNNAIIYINLECDNGILEEIRRSLHFAYKPMFKEKKYANERYATNQPCIAVYQLDGYYYRGIVKGLNPNGSYEVCFIDYGNVESLEAANMIPFAPFPKLHSLAARVRIHGIVPKKGSNYFATKVLDTIHIKLVNNLVSITLHPNENELSSVPTATIRVGGMNIADFLIENDMAELNLKAQHQRRTIKSNSQIDYNAASVRSEDRNQFKPKENTSRPEHTSIYLNESNTHPPLKCGMFDWTELADIAFNTTYDNNVMQPKSGTKKKNIYNNKLNENEYNEIYDSKIDGFTLKRNFEKDINGYEQELNKYEYTKISEQLLNRARIQHQAILEMKKFDPLETSTAFSVSTNTFNSLVAQRLPLGINEFFCTISSIASSTEIYISPDIAELKKFETQMLRDIKQLVEFLPPITKCTPGMYCLAKFSKDCEWYRAKVRSYNQIANEAVILYIDYMIIESLPLRELKALPDQLKDWPLRVWRAKLHGIKPNPEIREKDLQRSLCDCLTLQEKFYARIVNIHEDSDPDISTASNSRKCGQNVIHIQLYKNDKTQELIYQNLIDANKYVQTKESNDNSIDCLDYGFLDVDLKSH